MNAAQVMSPDIPHATFKQKWHSLKLCCTKLVAKVLSNEGSEYLGQLCDLIYYGSHIVWEQRRFDSAANPAEKQKAGEALAKSIRGMLNCQSKTLQAEQNASGSEDGEDLGLYTTGASTLFDDRIDKHEPFKTYVADMAQALLDEAQTSIVTLGNATNGQHRSWNKDVDVNDRAAVLEARRPQTSNRC